MCIQVYAFIGDVYEEIGESSLAAELYESLGATTPSRIATLVSVLHRSKNIDKARQVLDDAARVDQLVLLVARLQSPSFQAAKSAPGKSAEERAELSLAVGCGYIQIQCHREAAAILQPLSESSSLSDRVKLHALAHLTIATSW